jgi:single-stranded-DNA-specific exonuclease
VSIPDDPAQLWRMALDSFRAGPVLVLSHDDADGLSAAALLLRGLGRAGRKVVPRLVGRFESAWNGPLLPGEWGGVILA